MSMKEPNLTTCPDCKKETLIKLVDGGGGRSEDHTSELQSPDQLVCRLLLEKKKKTHQTSQHLERTVPQQTLEYTPQRRTYY